MTPNTLPNLVPQSFMKYRAVQLCAHRQPVTLIHGPPGTGKTAALAAAAVATAPQRMPAAALAPVVASSLAGRVALVGSPAESSIAAPWGLVVVRRSSPLLHCEVPAGEPGPGLRVVRAAWLPSGPKVDVGIVQVLCLWPWATEPWLSYPSSQSSLGRHRRCLLC